MLAEILALSVVKGLGKSAILSEISAALSRRGRAHLLALHQPANEGSAGWRREGHAEILGPMERGLGGAKVLTLHYRAAGESWSLLRALTDARTYAREFAMRHNLELVLFEAPGDWRHAVKVAMGADVVLIVTIRCALRFGLRLAKEMHARDVHAIVIEAYAPESYVTEREGVTVCGWGREIVGELTTLVEGALPCWR